MYDSNSFRKMQDEFFLNYGRKLTIQSSNVLFSSFHPTYGEGPHMLLLEEILQPDSLKLRNVEPSPDYLERLEQYSQTAVEIAETNQIAEQTGKLSPLDALNDKQGEEEVSSRASYMEAWVKQKTGEENILLPEQVQPIGLVVQSAIPIMQKESSTMNLKERFGKAVGMKLRKMVEEAKNRLEMRRKLAELNASVGGTQRNSTNKGGERVFSRPYKMYLTEEVENDSFYMRVRVSIWKLDPILEALMLHSVEISFDNKLMIYENSLYFSNNGEFIYFLLYNVEFHEFSKAIILRSNDLIQEREFELTDLQLESKFLDQSHSNIAKMLIDIPQLICILQPEQGQMAYSSQKAEISFNKNFFFYFPFTLHGELISVSGRELDFQYSLEDKSAKPKYQIKAVLFTSWNYKNDISMEKLFSISNRIIFVLKTALSEIKIVHMSLVKIKEHIKNFKTSGQGPQINMDQDVVDKYIFPFEEYLFEKFRVTATRDFEAKNIFICLKEESRQKKQQANLQQISGKKNAFYLLIVPQNNSSALEVGSNSKNSQQAKQAIIPLKFNFYLSKHLHLIKGNHYVSLFCQITKQYVAISTCDIFGVTDPNNVGRMNLQSLKHFKIEGTNEFRNSALFDMRPPCSQFQTLDTLGSTDDLYYMSQIVHSSYDQGNVQKKIVLERFQVMYLNPYIIIVENKTWMTIYSVYEKRFAYRFKLPQSFFSFVELNSGSMTLTDCSHYRHSTCMFMTTDKNQFIVLNVLHLPPISDVTQRFGLHPKFMISTLTNEGVIDWRIQKDQKLIKIVFGQLFDTLNDIDSSLNNFLIFQLEDQVFLKDLSKPGIASQYETGKTRVPLIAVSKLRGQYSGEQSFFFHYQNEDLTQHQIKWLRLISNSKGFEVQIKQVLLEKINYPVIKMDNLNGNFYFFDQNMTLRKFILDKGRAKLLSVSESRLIDDARIIFDRFDGKSMQLTTQGVFIGPAYFQALTQSEMKDSNYGFEQYRNKFIHTFAFCSLFQGPVMSQDKSRLIYLQYDDIENDLDPRKSVMIAKIDDSASKADITAIDQDELKRGASYIDTSVNKTVRDNQFIELTEKLKQSSSLRRITLSRRKTSKFQKSVGFKQANEDEYDDGKDTVIKIESEEDTRLHLNAFEIPLLVSQEMQVVHNDDFVLEQVDFTTFTPQDDVLVVLADLTMLAFDTKGYPVNLIEKHTIDFGQNPWKCQEIKILQLHPEEEKCLAMVFQQKIKMQKKCLNIVLKIEYQPKTKSYIVSQFGQTQVIQLQHPKNKIHSRLSMTGELYSLYSDDNKKISFMINDERSDEFEEKVNQVANAIYNLEQTDIQKRTKSVKRSKQDRTNSSTSFISAATEEKLIDSNTMFHDIQPNEEVVKAKYFKFELIHSTYMIILPTKSLNINYICLQEHNMPVKQIKLNMREGEIKQILQTDNDSYLQFVYEQQQPEYLRRNFIFTWDLVRNQELFNLRLVFDRDLQNKVHQVKVYKGVTENLNYYIPIKENYFYDLRYDFPVNIFSGHQANFESKFMKYKGYDTYFEEPEKLSLLSEIKVASNQRAILGISPEKRSTIQLSYQYLNLSYMEYVLAKFEQSSILVNGELELQGIILNFCKFTLKEQSSKMGRSGGDNILHVMKDKAVFQKKFRKEIDSQIHQDGKKDFINFIYLALVENDLQVSPLVSLIQGSQTKEIENLLKILLLSPERDYFIYIRNHFFQLLEMQNKKFEKFLDLCSYNVIFKTKLKWDKEKDQAFYTSKTRYIENQFLSQNFNLKKEEFYRPASAMHKPDCQAQDGQRGFFGRIYNAMNWVYEFIQGIDRQSILKRGKQRQSFTEPSSFVQNQKFEANKKNVTIKAYNFGYLLRGDYGRQFIKFLAQQKNDSSLFESEAVKAIIQTQWQSFKWQYLKYQFFPQVLYQIILLAFFSHLNPDTWTEQFRVNLDPDKKHLMKMTHNYIIDLVYLFASYFIILEANKAFRTWHILSFIPLLFDLTVMVNAVCSNLFHGTDMRLAYPEVVRHIEFLNGVTIIWSYFIFLLHFRVFETTGVLINVIFYIFKGTINYLIIFFMVNFGIGESLYLLSMTQDPLTDDEKFSGQNMFVNFIYAYKTSIGQQASNTMEDMLFFQTAFYIYYIVWTFVVAIVLTNLMIAMLNDIYSQMMAAQKTERYKMKCNLIWEDEFIFRRDKIFGESKYILKAQLDEDPSAREQRDMNVGIINTIVQRVRQSLVKDYENTARQFKTLEKKVNKSNEINVETLNQVIQSLEQIKIQLNKKGEE